MYNPYNFWINAYLVAIEDLGDAAVRDAQLPRDDTGPHPSRRHLHDLQSYVIRQGPPVDEHPSQLVHTTLAYRQTKL